MKKLLVLFALLSLLPVMICAAYFLPKIMQDNGRPAEQRPEVERVEIEAAPRPGPIPEPNGPVLHVRHPVEGRQATSPLVSRRPTNVRIVAAGETLSSIMRDYYGTGSSEYMNDVLRANPGLDPDRISVGQRITLPPKDDPAAASSTAALQDERQLTHTVLRGENLFDIAVKYYCDSAMYVRIFEYNRDQLSSPESLRVGMVLRLPPAPSYD